MSFSMGEQAVPWRMILRRIEGAMSSIVGPAAFLGPA